MTQLWMAFGHLVPLFLIVVLVGLIVFVILYLVNRKKMFNLKAAIINLLLTFTIIGILFVTVYPPAFGMKAPRLVNLVPFVEIFNTLFHSPDIMDAIRQLGFNILLFIPFGLFLEMRKRDNSIRIAKITALGFLFSLVIEIIQYIVPMGRVSDINDIILNTIGTFIGGFVWKLILKGSAQQSVSNIEVSK